MVRTRSQIRSRSQSKKRSTSRNKYSQKERGSKSQVIRYSSSSRSPERVSSRSSLLSVSEKSPRRHSRNDRRMSRNRDNIKKPKFDGKKYCSVTVRDGDGTTSFEMYADSESEANERPAMKSAIAGANKKSKKNVSKISKELNDLPFSPIEGARHSRTISSDEENPTFVLYKSSDNFKLRRRVTSTPKYLSTTKANESSFLRDLILNDIDKSKIGKDNQLDYTSEQIELRSKSPARKLFENDSKAQIISCILSAPLQIRTGQMVTIDPTDKSVQLSTITCISADGLTRDEFEKELAIAEEITPKVQSENTFLEVGNSTGESVQRVYVGHKSLMIEKTTTISNFDANLPSNKRNSRLYSEIAKGMIMESNKEFKRDQYLSMQYIDDVELNKDFLRKREFITLDFSSPAISSICEERAKSIPLKLNMLDDDERVHKFTQLHEDIFIDKDRILIDREVLIDTRATKMGRIWSTKIPTRKEERREYNFNDKDFNGALAYISEKMSNEEAVWKIEHIQKDKPRRMSTHLISELIKEVFDHSKVVMESPICSKFENESTLPVQNSNHSSSAAENSNEMTTNNNSDFAQDENNSIRREISQKLKDISRRSKGRLSTTLPCFGLSQKKKVDNGGNSTIACPSTCKMVIDTASNSEELKQHEKVVNVSALLNQQPYELMSKYLFMTKSDSVDIVPLKLEVDGKTVFDVRNNVKQQEQQGPNV